MEEAGFSGGSLASVRRHGKPLFKVRSSGDILISHLENQFGR